MFSHFSPKVTDFFRLEKGLSETNVSDLDKCLISHLSNNGGEKLVTFRVCPQIISEFSEILDFTF